MNYSIPFYYKICCFLIQSTVLFCGFYVQSATCFTLSYGITFVYGVGALLLPIYFKAEEQSNEFILKRQTQYRFFSLSFVGGIALCCFTALGTLFFENTYHLEAITLFFAMVAIIAAIEPPPARLLRWENDGLLIMGEKFSNTIPYGTISNYEVDFDSITIYTQEGYTHFIENIIWDQETMEKAIIFLNSRK